MAAPVVLADREPALPVPAGVKASRVEGATIRAPVGVAPATIDAGGPAGAKQVVRSVVVDSPVVDSPAGISVSHPRAAEV